MEIQRGEEELLLTCRVEEEGITLLRCACGSRRVRLPGVVLGRPVTALGDYALARREPRLQGEIRQVWITCGGDRPPEHRAEELREVVLPQGLEAVGDYAFYNCLRLEKLTLPGTVTRLGRGALMNCAALAFVEMGPGEGAGCLGRLLSEQAGDLEVALHTAAGEARLFFPAYLEEMELLVAPHIFQHHIQGGGYACRQCVGRAGVDFIQYDRCLSRLEGEGDFAAAGRMALCRLRWPVELSPRARENYEALLRGRGEEVAPALVERGEEGALSFLLERGLLRGEALEAACDQARRLGRTALLALLLEGGRDREGPGRRRRFEL